jgi:hypothetical protein
MLRRMPSRLAAVLLVFPLLAGCGGAKKAAPPATSPTSAAPSPLSRAAYVAAVNKVCVDVGTATDAVPEPKAAADYPTALNGIIGALEGGQRKLRALVPPAADQAAVESNLLALNDEQVAALRAALPKVQAAAGRGDKAGAEAAFNAGAEEFGKVAGRQEAWAKSFGLTDCVG